MLGEVTFQTLSQVWYAEDMNTYKVIRFYQDPDKSPHTIKRGLTLEEAQEHCRRPDTRKEGEWFDGYESE